MLKLSNIVGVQVRRAAPSLISIVLLCMALAPSAFAQGSRHTETWNFGKRCRVTFDVAGNLNASLDPSISTNEGCASFSHPSTGDFLLYTDGSNVWDKQGTLLAFDLPGHSSSMHSGIIVPRPLNPYKVYAIGHDRINSASLGAREFDVSDPANVLTIGGNQSIVLDSGVENGQEGMLIAPHSNGIDFWVIVAGKRSLFVIPVTASGLGTARKIVTNVTFTIYGVFALSNDSKRLVLSNRSRGSIYSFDFDPTTGTIPTNNGVAIRTEMVVNNDKEKYGGTFSPDDTKMYYVSLGGPGDTSRLYQFDFNTMTQTLIDEQRTRYFHAQTKLAQNGKIYIATGDNKKAALSVIEKPNNPASSIGFSYASVPMPKGCDPALGLPQTLSPLVVVTLGIEVTGPKGTILGDTVTPTGTANLPNGTVIAVTVTGDGFAGECTAVVKNGKWSCPKDSITGLPADKKFTVVASDGNNKGEGTFFAKECKVGDSCEKDECKLGTDNCDENATCTNIVKGFTCKCNEPYKGDGVTCEMEAVVDMGSDMPEVDSGSDSGVEDMAKVDMNKPEADMGKSDQGSSVVDTGTEKPKGLILSGGGCSSIDSTPSAMWLMLLGFFVALRPRRKSKV